MTMTLDQKRVRDLFHYDPDTGHLVNRYTRGRLAKAGTIAGHPHKQGYVAINIGGKGYLAHRVIWLYVTGEWPRRQIDHIDLNKANNKWGNLREASGSQNCANRPVRADSTNGLKGVRRKRHRWQAVISADGRRRSLGYFDTPEEAHAAYSHAAAALHGEFARAA